MAHTIHIASNSIVEAKQTKHSTTLEFRKLSTRPLDWLLRTGPGRDLVERQIYPNAKEVTEAWAIHQACRHHIPGWGEGHQCYEIGSGVTPRCSCMILFRTKHPTTSTAIDPDLRVADYKTDRLSLFPGTLGAFVKEEMRTERRFNHGLTPVFILPHSHAPQDEISALLDALEVDSWWVEMPCCKKHNLATLFKSAGFEAAIRAEYRDRDCLSAKNKIRVWRVKA